MNEYRLTQDDIRTIADIVKDYVNTQPHSMREAEYPAILQAVADGMCWDDSIVTDREVTGYVHG